MKKIILISLICAAICSCSTSKPKSGEKPLFEVLTQQPDGGGNIRFFEILTEEKEIRMLQSDDNLRKKIKPEDLTSSNFIILNMGEKSTGGYSIGVEKVEETPDKIVITIKETEPAPGSMVSQSITYPYAVVKVNSKKEIVVK